MAAAFTNKCAFIVVVAFAAACGSHKDTAIDSGSTLITDKADLAKRIHTSDTALSLVEVSVGSMLVPNRVDSDLNLTLVGDIDPPTFGKSQLQATDVFVSGNKAIISYNMAGEEKLGALDLVNIAHPDRPDLIAILTFADRDINALAFRDGYVFATGSWQADPPSFLSKIRVRDGLFTKERTELGLAGYAGTGVIVNSSKIFVSTGDNSGLQRLTRKTLAIESTFKISDARAVAQRSESEPVWVLSGQPGKLSELSAEGELKSTFTIGGATIPQSKSTIAIGRKWSLAAVGDGGAIVTCNADGKSVTKVPAAVVSGLPPERTVTNAAAAANGYLYTANGEAGVYVYKIARSKIDSTDCQDFSAQLVGRIDFGKSLSANQILVRNNILYVGDGLGGLKIVTVKRATVPSDLEIADFDRDDDDNEDFDRTFPDD